MSDLQIALAAFGAVLVAGVAIYNAVQERRARARAEKAFGERPGDALFNAEGERREPTFGSLPPSDIVEALEDAGNEARPAAAPAAPPAEALQASGGPPAQAPNRRDPVAGVGGGGGSARRSWRGWRRTPTRRTSKESSTNSGIRSRRRSPAAGASCAWACSSRAGAARSPRTRSSVSTRRSPTSRPQWARCRSARLPRPPRCARRRSTSSARTPTSRSP